MRWTLHARRGLALFWPFLHLLDDGAKPAAHGISRLICNFQHTGMAVLHGLDAGGHIGDAADRKHLHSHIVADQRFWYGAHAHGICAHACKVTDLGSSLVAGTHESQIDALLVSELFDRHE